MSLDQCVVCIDNFTEKLEDRHRLRRKSYKEAMKLTSFAVIFNLVAWADAHGYLTIPSSRTRLGFEVKDFTYVSTW